MNNFELCIIKVTSFCNINCTYCYMFNANDNTFKRVPKSMSKEVALKFLNRLEEYLDVCRSNRFHITLHGGEPTLWSMATLLSFLNKIREMNSRGYRLTVSIQTNGFLYKPKLFEILAEHEVSVGVSLDGPRDYNDQRRVTHRGTGSYDSVITNVEKILNSSAAKVFQGFLSVADPSISPEAFVNWIGTLPVTKMDLLWPMDFSYKNPPWNQGSEIEYRIMPVYGRWFADVFDTWLTKNDETIYIRHFFDCIEHYLGSNRHIESIVNDSVPMFVVNTDGQYEYHDYFRPYEDGKCRTSTNLVDSPIAVLHEDLTFRKLLTLSNYLPKECASCDVSPICGGGFLPGRVGGADDMSRSVLCHDQSYFFVRMRKSLEKLGVQPASGRSITAQDTLRPLFFERSP